jgi:hypothetical protein
MRERKRTDCRKLGQRICVPRRWPVRYAYQRHGGRVGIRSSVCAAVTSSMACQPCSRPSSTSRPSPPANGFGSWANSARSQFDQHARGCDLRGRARRARSHVSAISARHSRVKSSTIARIRKRRPSDNAILLRNQTDEVFDTHRRHTATRLTTICESNEYSASRHR